jgi:hypothetical protein
MPRAAKLEELSKNPENVWHAQLAAAQPKLYSLREALRQTTLRSKELLGTKEIRIRDEFALLQVAPSITQFLIQFAGLEILKDLKSPGSSQIMKEE